jgi:hypothetical protein
MEEVIDGQQIVSMSTLKTMYDNNSIRAVLDTGESVRIKADEIIKFVNGTKFIRNKKRVNTYLEVIDGQN